jgi:hypothetical protein
MSEVKVNKISPRSGTTITLGDSGDTISIPSGVTFDASSGGLAGTLTTAAQPNITSVGTLTSFTSTGIDDNATSTAITIDSSENVGIGTTTPDELLTVALSGSTGTYFEAGGTTDNSNARRLIISASTTTNAGDTHTLNAESATGNIAFATNNTERLRILKDGKIAINNTTADTTFHVGNSTDTSEYITLQSSGDKRLTFKGASVYRADIGVFESNHNDLVLRTGSSAGIRFVTNNQNFSGSGSDTIKIDTNGRLGIGTISPSQKLDVVGSIEVSDGIYIGGTGSANKLDDYEEGTWTVTTEPNTGFTPTGNTTTGTYVKVGNVVTVVGRASMTVPASLGTYVNNSIGNNVTVSGLPFTVPTTSVKWSAVTLAISTKFATVSGTLVGEGNGNTTSFSIWDSKDNGSTRMSPTLTTSASHAIGFQFTYIIA